MAPHGEKLKVSNGEALVKVHVDGKDVTNGKFETDQENVSVEITAKETGIYQLPVDDSLYQIEIIRNDKSEEIPYQVMNESEFNVETELSVLKNAETVAASSDAAITTEEQIVSKIIRGTSPDNDTKGTLYLVLEKDKKITLNIKNILAEPQDIVLMDSNDKEETQQLISFIKKATKESEKKEDTKEKTKTNTEQDSKKEETTGTSKASTEEDSKKITTKESSITKEKSETTSKNKSTTKNNNSAKGMAVSVDDIQLRGTNDVVAFKNLTLNIRTGEKNFDPDDAAGHDSSPTNTIVRTWDKVSYNYSFSLESKNAGKTYTSIRYRVDASFKDTRKKVSGQLRDYAYFPEGSLTGNNAAETRDSSYTTEGVLGSSGIVDSVVNLQVLGATHNYELKPTIVITILEATEVETGKVIEINSSSDDLVNQSVKVSAKPNVKAEFADNTDLQYMSALTDDSSLNAMAKPLGMKFSIVPLTDSGISRTGSLFEQLYGSTYPTGNTKVTVQTKARFVDNAGPTTNIVYGTHQKQPQVAFYGLLGSAGGDSSDGFTKTSEFNSYTFRKMLVSGVWTMPGSVDPTANKNSLLYVHDTSNATVANTSTDTITFTINNPAAIHRDGLMHYANRGIQENVSRSTFASVATITSMPYDYMLDKNGSIYTDFNTTNIEYDGLKQTNTASYTYQRRNLLPGSMIAFTPVTDNNEVKVGSSPDNWSFPSGDGAVYKNQKIYAHGQYVVNSLDATLNYGITAWNANSFEYDNTREIKTIFQTSQGSDGKVNRLQYGVRKDGGKTPDLTVKFTVMNGAYNWYSSYDAAKTAGTISAVKGVYQKTGIESRLSVRCMIPLIAVGPTNNQAKDKYQNSNIFVSSNGMYKGTETAPVAMMFYPDDATNISSIYTPTEYNSDNKLLNYHTPPNVYGETIQIVPFTTRISKQAVRASYSSDEVVQWKLTPRIEADADDTVTMTITDALPKELVYISGSTSYGGQNIEPAIKEESDGSTTLTWKISYHKTDEPIKELVFDTIVNGRNIVYDSSNTKSVTNSTVISAENKSGLIDGSAETLRTAEASTTITKVSTTVIQKSTPTTMIEMGNQDDALASGNKEKNTTIKYTLYNKNEAKNIAYDTKILDVLPSATDGRGTTYTGNYELKNIKVTNSSGSTAKVFYTKQSIAASTEPNDVSTASGWSVYTSGSVSGVKAIYVEYGQLAVDESTEVEIELIPSGQKSGDVFVNSAKLDNYNFSPVESVHVKTTVVSRSLEGVAWYDDNMDGIKDTSEALAKDIPVKLYRTSHDNSTYKNELVKQSLTGVKFIDGSGDSLIKTNVAGEYKFENLPEGDYVAYFEIDGQIVAQNFKVTKKDTAVSSQAVNTSKADKTTYKTDSYTTPTVSSGQFVGNHVDVKNINLGLIRQSRVRLFKFETGSAVDADGDGQLSDAEKATGKPLANATFDIYKGDMEEKIGTATTDSSGYLEFDKLYAGDYTLVETKAPSGYELIKNPIKVTITEGNQDVVVYQDNDKAAELPFTGGNGPLLAILLAASGALVLGFGYVLWYYRTPKKKGVR